MVLALISQGVWGYLKYIVLFYLLIFGFSLLTLPLLPTPATPTYDSGQSFWKPCSPDCKCLYSTCPFVVFGLCCHLYRDIFIPTWSWWWTGRPGMLWFMGSQRVGHDWATELNWTELNWTVWIQNVSFSFLASELCVSASERPAPFSQVLKCYFNHSCCLCCSGCLLPSVRAQFIATHAAHHLCGQQTCLWF